MAAAISESATTANTAKPNDGLSTVAAMALQGAGQTASGVLGGVAQVANSSAVVPLLLVGGGVALAVWLTGRRKGR
ncbi:MAG: hypothetical protein EPO65_06750 [Dehalococcoidia bacterium]|nr:MAG: hypothetical protein EPO65_06750 [Dehalococcoidia bacterium]